jgi:hypothetical protein
VKADGGDRFAPEWFADAVREALGGPGLHARRREILFAVCFAEAYIVEWALHDVLGGDMHKFQMYFPHGRRRRSAIDKWREVPDELFRDGLIAKAPKRRAAYWQRFQELSEERDRLVHAVFSRPEESAAQFRAKLDHMPPGWAIRTAVNLVLNLHETLGTRVPEWIVLPDSLSEEL